MPTNRGRLPDYIFSRTDQWIVIRENDKLARFHNPDKQEILLIHVDGGLIDDGARADYIVAHPAIVDVIVELKGKDVAKAIRQIRATVAIWRRHESAGRRLSALVVRSRGTHPKLSASMDRWEREFRRELNMKLLFRASNRDYEFNEFLLERSANG
jgi:hypothetical protein